MTKNEDETQEDTPETTEETKSNLIKDTKHVRGYVVFNREDIEAIDLDWDTVTSKILNDKVRDVMGLPEKVRTSAMKAEMEEAREKLGLEEGASQKEILSALKDKAGI